MMHLPRCNAARKKKDPASHIPIPSLPDAKTPRVEVSSNVGKKHPLLLPFLPLPSPVP